MSRIRLELQKARKELLDPGLRNTLINFRQLKTKGIEVVDELPREVFRLLVRQERPMSFLPAPEELVEGSERRVRGDLLVEWLEAHELPAEGNGEDGPAERHQDTKLQTAYTAARLERLLLNTYYTAHTSIEEHGVNTLYLALGMLRWFESSTSEEERSAPLILVPVSLDRTSARSKFRIEYTGEELGDNLSLKAKLRTEFGVELPSLPPAEDLHPVRYLEQVGDAVREQNRWHVDGHAIHLGFFWFTKLLMYEDLEPEHWPGEETLENHPVMSSLLGDGFADHPSPFPDGSHLDDYIAPADLHTIRDTDSSQTLAILDVQAGRNLVIQGPPGTGKSQTISNLIAENVAQGRRVLFVAEKMAALDVVKRRLDEDGVGDTCLELHSHRTNKRLVIEELRRTLRLGKPDFRGIEGLETLTEYRDQLNAYSAAVNTSIGESGITPYLAYGEVLAARERMGSESPLPLENSNGWADWTGSEFRERLRVVKNLETLIGETGVLADHPFWSSCRVSYGLRDRDRLLPLLDKLDGGVRTAREGLKELAELLGLRPPASFREAKRLIAAATKRLQMPRIEGMAIGDAAWREEEHLGRLIEDGLRYQGLHREFDPELLPEAWERDVLALRAALVQFGRRWWRFLAPQYRQAIRDLRTLTCARLPKAIEERLSLVETIRESQRLERAFEEQRDLAERLFGAHWRGGRSDWDRLRAACSWLQQVHADLQTEVLPDDFLACATSVLNDARLQASAERVNNLLQESERLLGELEDLLELRRGTEWLRVDGQIQLSFEELGQRISRWRGDPDALHDIVRYNNLDTELREVGLGELSDLSTHWPAAGKHLVDFVAYEWYSALVERAMSERKELARFEGRSHAETVRAFQDLDGQSIEVNRARVALAHWNQLPTVDGGGQLAILRHEMEKKRRHLPIRQLMDKAGEAIQRIKPVFMMSPLSIATYIPPGSVSFDVVIFDEASQIRPVDAFGAILRGRQAVVVGDSKQLPPTSFFEKLLDDIEVEDEERSAAGDLESILGLFVSKNAPERMLRWHYRSRHDSLIAVSNYEFYDNGLLIFPSPDHAKEELGVVLRHHPETVYEPGTKRFNLREAEMVADAVMEHARTRRDLSLGVAAFSQSQSQALQDQVELRRRESPELETFFNSDKEEPFFVKNLENVQGDERDIILISVGYGRQESGAFWMNFGPLNQDGGERRLNVLTTRARLRCEVFSNFRADEIDLSKTSARGVAALKRYLQFAEDGRLDLPKPSERPPDSVFEELVADKVRSLGYEVHPQVGSGGFFIDLAVVDPRRPGRYLLGIECDGRSYHSSAWARDRDRLRQQVLEGLGWSLHRVWSTDWFRSQDRELERIAESLERARASGTVGGSDDPGKARRKSVTRAELRGKPFRRENGEHHDRHLESEPYRCANLSKLRGRLGRRELHTCSGEWIAPWVVTVVEIESPVHEDEVVRRIVDAAGYQRTGSRLQEAVLRGVTRAVRRSQLERRGDFLWAKDQHELTVRNRDALPPVARSMGRIAPEEIEAAVERVVDAAVGIDTDEAVVQVSRLFGFARTTEAMREPIVRAISALVERDVVEEAGGYLRRRTRSG